MRPVRVCSIRYALGNPSFASALQDAAKCFTNDLYILRGHAVIHWKRNNPICDFSRDWELEELRSLLKIRLLSQVRAEVSSCNYPTSCELCNDLVARLMMVGREQRRHELQYRLRT